MKGKVFLNFSNLTRSGQKKKNLIELVSYMISPTVAEMKCNQLLLLEIKFQGCGTKELFLLSYCSFACLSFFALFLCLFSRAFFKECRRNILYDEYDVHSFPVRRISTRRNDWRFRLEIATKLLCHKTIFNFHMNNFGKIFENIYKC